MTWSRLLLSASMLLAPIGVYGCSAEAGVEPRGSTHGALGQGQGVQRSSSAAKGTALVVTARVELYESPSKKSMLRRVLAKGTQVKALGDSKAGFVHVEVTGADDAGWAAAESLSATGDDASGDDSAESTDDGASASASASPGSAPSIAGDCVDAINQYRQDQGLPALERWTDQESCADDEAASDGASGTAHGAFPSCGESAQNECPGYPGDPESAIPGCLQQMVDEGPGGGHYDNIFSTDFTQVACGLEVVDGSLWAVQDFR